MMSTLKRFNVLASENAGAKTSLAVHTDAAHKRRAIVCFGDASLSIFEDGYRVVYRDMGEVAARKWEETYRHEVFNHILLLIKRLGWKKLPPSSSPDTICRTYQKGDLYADVRIGNGRINIQMSHGHNRLHARTQQDQEGCMPFLDRMEMERTRRHIAVFLCDIFPGYKFDARKRSIYLKPLQKTAVQRLQEHYEQSWHFKGDSKRFKIAKAYAKSHDGKTLRHGQIVWFFDIKGRLCMGTAHYNLNDMWFVAVGKYELLNKYCYELYANCPVQPRAERTERIALQIDDECSQAGARSPSEEDTLQEEHRHKIEELFRIELLAITSMTESTRFKGLISAMQASPNQVSTKLATDKALSRRIAGIGACA